MAQMTAEISSTTCTISKCHGTEVVWKNNGDHKSKYLQSKHLQAPGSHEQSARMGATREIDRDYKILLD